MKNHVVCKRPVARKTPDIICAGIIRKLFADKTTSLIAIGGPGGSGKSTFCKKIIRCLEGDVSLLSLDDYKTPRLQRANLNIFGPHPKANRIDLIREHLSSLKRGLDIRKPVYNAVSGEADSEELVQTAKYIIIDGEISTYSCFQEYIDFSVFIDSDWKTQLNTRITRDIEKRKYSRHKAISTFLKSNLEEFTEFGAESKKNADLHIFCNSNYQLAIESVDQNIFHLFDEISQHDYSELAIEGEAVRLIYPLGADNFPDHEYFLKMVDWLSSREVKRVIISDLFDLGFLLSKKELAGYIELALEFFPGLVFFETSIKNISDFKQELDFYAMIGVDAIIISFNNQYIKFRESGSEIAEYLRELSEYLKLPVFSSIKRDEAELFSNNDRKIIMKNYINAADIMPDNSLKEYRRCLNKHLPGFPQYLRAPCRDL